MAPCRPPRHPLRLVLAGALAASATPGHASPANAETELRPVLQVVESVPVGTPLNRPDVPDARDVWPALIDEATATIDWAAFYVSGYQGSSMDLVLEALYRAADRGVAIRLVAERVFYDTYPEILDELNESRGIEVRLIDYRALAGGVMHAKYFVVDGATAFMGSQNFDWRALDHIVEMGLEVRLPAYARALLEIFERDWTRGYVVGTSPPDAAPPGEGVASTPTGGEGGAERAAGGGDGNGEPSAESVIAAQSANLIARPSPIAFTARSGETVTLYPAFSPRDDLPHPSQWDLPLIVEMIDSASDSLHVTLLTYSPVARDGTYWPTFETALRAAAARGVAVHLMVADWGKRTPTIDYLKSLECVPGIEVRMVTLPEAEAGFIPYARVTHAKYLTVDGRRFWLGTSNWEKSYFMTSRNVGVIADHPGVVRTLDDGFDALWRSPFAHVVDPAVIYEPPRISK